MDAGELAARLAALGYRADGVLHPASVPLVQR
jgi:hypothetical protein